MSAPGRRILVIVSDRIGDVLFCTPALRLLRRAEPAARIEVLAQSAAAAEIFRGSPRVDVVHGTDAADALVAGPRFDLVIDFKRNRFARGLVERLGLPPQRVARTAQEHEADAALAVVERVTGVARDPAELGYELFPDARDAARADALLDRAGVRAGEVLLGCHMGCNRVARRGWRFWKPATHPKAWPIARFEALAERLARTHPHVRLVLTGSRSERPLARRVRRHAPRAVDAIGETSVRELHALVRRCRAFLTADTGPLHVACAADVPLVALFGATPVEWFGPWPPAPHRTVLHGEPLGAIGVEAVVEALEKLPGGLAPAAQEARAARSDGASGKL